MLRREPADTPGPFGQAEADKIVFHQSWQNQTVKPDQETAADGAKRPCAVRFTPEQTAQRSGPELYDSHKWDNPDADQGVTVTNEPVIQKTGCQKQSHHDPATGQQVSAQPV